MLFARDRFSLRSTFRSICLSLLFFSLLCPTLAMAHADGGIEIDEAWVREAPPNAQVLAAYMQIGNHSKTEKKVISVSSSAFEKVEIHKTTETNGMMKMEKIDSLNIPAQGKVTLGPGGLHMMLIHPKHALKVGDTVSLTLNFTDNSKTVISVPVKKDMGGDHDHMNMDMSGEHDHMDMGKDHDGGHASDPMPEHHHDM